MTGILRLSLLCCLFAGANAGRSRLGTFATASMLGKNPIRKIVTLLQDMQKELEAESVKEKELHEKFMCFCSSHGGELAGAAEKATMAIEELTAKAVSEESEGTQLAQELVDHKTDRENAKKDLAEATSLREKEVAEYGASSAELRTNIEGISNAVQVLEKATGGSFVQLPRSNLLKRLADQVQNVDEWDRKGLVAFIEQKSEAPASGQIVGVLKQMKDEFEANEKQANEDEANAASGFAELKGSKAKEIELASEAIESKTVRSGELAVSLAQTKDELEDTQAELEETTQGEAQMKKDCSNKEQAFAEASKARLDEISAVGEAIGILNGDEALAVLQKAVPSVLVQAAGPAYGFLQQNTPNHRASRKHRAQALLAEAATKYPSPTLRLILFAMNSKLKMQTKGKMQKFDDVIKMVDEMVVVLGKEQQNDEKSKTWCAAEFDKSADEQAATKSKDKALDASIEEGEDDLSNLADEIATLGQQIKDLDRAVAQATEQRKEEHGAYMEAMTLNEAASSLIEKAKARLAKVYSFAQTSSQSDDEDTEEVSSKKSSGVMALMDTLIRDLESGMKDAEYEEKTAQKDYAELMEDSQKSRAQDMKSLTGRESAKANVEMRQQDSKQSKQSTADELQSIQEYIHNLHSSCDFITENFAIRKEARTNEIESLKNAKAVLSGADFR